MRENECECLYCLKNKDKKEFSKEHVIPRQLGNFNFPTIKICKECNNKFSHDFETDIAMQSNIKDIIECKIDNNTLVKTIREFKENENTQRFLFKICFNFLYLILPKELFCDLNKSAYNSINLLRNIIFNRVTIGNDSITIIMPTSVDVKNFREEYNIILSNNSNSRFLEVQFDICNYFTIKFPLRIETSGDSKFTYMFTFDKRTGNVSILDWENGPLGNWNSNTKKQIQNKLISIIK